MSTKAERRNVSASFNCRSSYDKDKGGSGFVLKFQRIHLRVQLVGRFQKHPTPYQRNVLRKLGPNSFNSILNHARRKVAKQLEF